MDSVTTLVDDKLFGLGGVVPADGRTSWLPVGARGYSPVNCYLVTTGRSALLVDTGVPAHASIVLRQLREKLERDSPLSIFHTRIVEFDSLGNSAEIIRSFPSERLYANFPAHAHIHYRPLLDPPLRTDVRGQEVEEQIVRAGDVIELPNGRAEPRRLVVIDAPLRLLVTYWLYDLDTKTLFTSDSFGHVTLEGPTSPRVIDRRTDTATLATVREHLFTKFDWLTAADTSRIRDELVAIFGTYDVAAIAPAHGCVLSGRDVVARHYRLLDTALAEAA